MTIPSVEEETAYWEAEAERKGIPFTGPARHPCATCPWRLKFHRGVENPKFPHPGIIHHTWRGYRAEVGGAQDGLLVMCHRGVHSMTPEEDQVFDSHRVCAGSVAVQQREAIRRYLGQMSYVDEDAAERIGRRMGVPLRVWRRRILTREDLVSRAHPAISDPDVGHPDLMPPRPREFAVDKPLDVFDVTPHRAISDRDRIEVVSGFDVDAKRGVVRVAASSAGLARVWLRARLEAP